MLDISLEQSKKYIVGGIDEIVNLVSSELSYNDKGALKRQFLKQDSIKLNNLNDFDVFGLANIVREVASGLLPIGCRDYVEESLNGEILLFGRSGVLNNDYKDKCIQFVINSKLEESDKIQIINSLENFKIEFYMTEFLRDIYKEDSFYELNKIIPFVEDITAEYEYRLQNLNTYVSLLRKAIIKNDEIIKRKSRAYLKECAEVINNCLKIILRKIENDLQQYLKNLNNEFQNLLEERESRADILNQLFENNQKLNIFLNYENILAERHLLSKNLEQWLSSPLLLIKFYSFCEYNGLLKERFAKKTTGVRLFRQLYNFHEGDSIDKPSKRNVFCNPTFLNAEFFYLRHF
jgi:hypothetical protein